MSTNGKTPEPQPRPRDPANIAHLAEFGTVREQAKPFLRPAYDQGRQQAAAILRDEVAAALREFD